MAKRFDQIIEMRKERKKVWEDARKYREEKEAANEGGKLLAEEQRSYNERLDTVEQLTKDIEQAERELELEERMLEDQAKKASEETAGGDPHQEAYRSAFDAYLRNGLTGVTDEQRTMLMSNQQTIEARAMGVGTDSAGGYTVPDEMMASVVDAMKQFNGIRRSRAEVITTQHGRDIPMPTGDDTGNVGELLGENTQAATQDITMGSKTLGAFMFSSKIIRVSYQLLQDTAVDIEAYLRAKLGERIGRITSQYFTTGTGSAQPEGVVTGSTAGKTATGTTALTYDEVLDLIHSVDPAYRLSAELMFNDSTLLALKKLKDSENRPLWLPGTQLREPDTINGYPYVINQEMDDIEASGKSMLFGDFSTFKIRDVNGGMILRLTERYADYAQVGFIGFFRHGSVLADAGSAPIKHLVQAAT